MGGPGADMMYGGGGIDAGGMMGAVGGAQARMYGAAASPRPAANGMPRGGGGAGPAGPKSGSSSELVPDALGGGGGSGGNWVQIMDPDGKVYLVNQAGGPGGGGQ
jgi:hypothetical protein